MNLGNKIIVLRLKAGATQEMLANDLGVSCQSVSKWENDVCAPDITLLPKISEFFGVTIDELFDLSVDQKLHRIENMLDYETELSDADFRETERFLTEQLETYDVTHPEHPNGRIYSFLAHLYHHRMGRVDTIDVFTNFNKRLVCGNMSTISYVRGNISTNRTVQVFLNSSPLLTYITLNIP